MAAKKIEIGESGRSVALNVTIRRATAGLAVAELAEKVTAAGRHLTRQALSEIEAGRRRVDADDLAALALALETSPAALLMPRADHAEDVVSRTGARMPAHVVWAWLSAQAPREVPDDPDEAERRRGVGPATPTPPWARPR